jgi:hypothetical protein
LFKQDYDFARVLAWNTKRRVLDVDSVPPGRLVLELLIQKEKLMMISKAEMFKS